MYICMEEITYMTVHMLAWCACVCVCIRTIHAHTDYVFFCIYKDILTLKVKVLYVASCIHFNAINIYAHSTHIVVSFKITFFLTI